MSLQQPDSGPKRSLTEAFGMGKDWVALEAFSVIEEGVSQSEREDSQ